MAPVVFNSAPSVLPGIQLTIEPKPLDTPPSSSLGDVQPSSDDQHETQLQECWDKSIAKHMNLWEGYHNVHVLMVKWNDDIDQLNVKTEVDELTEVFEEIFNYDVVRVELNTTKAQHQLDMEISRWVYLNDSPNTLLIVYYAGHGIYDMRTKVLEIAPNNYDGPQANWSRSEKPFIETAKADVFMIMDCCYASDILRNIPELGRTFEMLAASHIGQPTPEPGENSFTHCLIKHLRELGAESSSPSFTTFDIQERMQRDRKEDAPALWRRIPGNSRHIRLRKLKPLQDRPKEHNGRSQYSQFLHLGFALRRECFQEQHIEKLTKRLPSLFAEAGLPLVDIKWLGCRKASSSKFREVVEMYLVRSRSDAFAASPIAGTKRTMDDSDFDMESQPKLKRASLSIHSD